jgi:hypothetical protein
MIDFLLVTTQLLVSLGISLAIAYPRGRPAAAIGLTALGVATLIAALSSGGERSLTVTATFPAYDELLIVPTAFAVEDVTAPSPIWALLTAAFAGLWALWAWARRRGPVPGPFTLPLALAWTSTALWLALQKSAAPAILVQPHGLDRFLWPATLVAGLILAKRCERVVHLILYLSLFIALGRLPIAIFSVLASNNHWGTTLDISSITLFANPLVQQPIEVTAGSTDQHLWLIWLQHMVMMPGIYMMSIGGIAFATFLYLKHAPQD